MSCPTTSVNLDPMRSHRRFGLSREHAGGTRAARNGTSPPRIALCVHQPQHRCTLHGLAWLTSPAGNTHAESTICLCHKTLAGLIRRMSVARRLHLRAISAHHPPPPSPLASPSPRRRASRRSLQPRSSDLGHRRRATASHPPNTARSGTPTTTAPHLYPWVKAERWAIAGLRDVPEYEHLLRYAGGVDLHGPGPYPCRWCGPD
jgi:hypothetical protein